MITILVGTNRPHSISRSIAEIYESILKQNGVESRILDLVSLPPQFIFSALYDNAGKDTEFNKLKESINDSSKFIFIVPEYNGSFPGVLKAFIDGLDYPQSLKNKKVALVGISAGIMGGTLALSHLTDILHYVGVHVLPTKIKLSRIEAILKNGKITDDFLVKLLENQAEELIRW